MSEYVIEMNHIRKEFPGIVANDDITLQLKKGEIHALLGENGAGKSTLMSVLFGLYQPEAGEIKKNGKVVKINDPNDATDLGIGMVHQHFKLIDVFTVLDNIVLGAETTGKFGILKKKEAREKVMALSEKYGLKVDVDAKIEDISVGMQQRVEILKALYLGAELLIMDEPTAVLTPQEIVKLFETLVELRNAGKTIILITHKLNEIMKITDEIMILRLGKVTGHVKTAETTERKIAEMMVGRQLKEPSAKAKVDQSRVVLEVKQVSFVDKWGVKALDNISLTLHSGEILGIAGVQGNGQSELIDVLSGMINHYSGEVRICDHLCQPSTGTRERREFGLGCIPEDRQVTGAAVGGTILANFIMVGYRTRAFANRIFINYKKAKEICWKYVKQFTVKTDNIMNDAVSLSGGNLQKLIVAREMYLNPEVLIAAQPSRGVDIGATEYIHEKLVEHRNHGKSVLLVSNELSEIMEVSDRVLVIYKGRFVGEVNPMNTTEEKIGLLMAGITEEVSA